MKVYELPFGRINIIEKKLAEVIINDGVEMNVDMVEVYHQFLLQHLEAPFSLLVNKINSYSYTFDAQLKIAGLKEIDYMAVVIYKFSTEMATKILIDINRGNDWNINLFKNREEDLEWLSIVRNNSKAI